MFLLSTEWNLVRLSGPAHGIVTKNCIQNSTGVVGVRGGRVVVRGLSGVGGGGGQGVVGSGVGCGGVRRTMGGGGQEG